MLVDLRPVGASAAVGVGCFRPFAGASPAPASAQENSPPPPPLCVLAPRACGRPGRRVLVELVEPRRRRLSGRRGALTGVRAPLRGPRPHLSLLSPGPRLSHRWPPQAPGPTPPSEMLLVPRVPLVLPLLLPLLGSAEAQVNPGNSAVARPPRGAGRRGPQGRFRPLPSRLRGKAGHGGSGSSEPPPRPCGTSRGRGVRRGRGKQPSALHPGEPEGAAEAWLSPCGPGLRVPRESRRALRPLAWRGL